MAQASLVVCAVIAYDSIEEDARGDKDPLQIAVTGVAAGLAA